MKPGSTIVSDASITVAVAEILGCTAAILRTFDQNVGFVEIADTPRRSLSTTPAFEQGAFRSLLGIRRPRTACSCKTSEAPVT